MSGSQSEMDDLFDGAFANGAEVEMLAEGAMLFRCFAAAEAVAIFQTVQQIAAISPFRHMVTPGGHRMSVAMTNCGRVGWTTDRRGYRYDPLDPDNGAPWPAMPPALRQLVERSSRPASKRTRESGCPVCVDPRDTPNAPGLALNAFEKVGNDFAFDEVEAHNGLGCLRGEMDRGEETKKFEEALRKYEVELVAAASGMCVLRYGNEETICRLPDEHSDVEELVKQAIHTAWRTGRSERRRTLDITLLCTPGEVKLLDP
jgi:hypothetical protein